MSFFLFSQEKSVSSSKTSQKSFHYFFMTTMKRKANVHDLNTDAKARKNHYTKPVCF